MSADSELVIATNYLQIQVVRAALEQNTIKIKVIYEQLTNVSILRGAAGYVFESLVHQGDPKRKKPCSKRYPDGKERPKIRIQGGLELVGCRNSKQPLEKRPLERALGHEIPTTPACTCGLHIKLFRVHTLW
jgi:hypothetical protein